MDVQPNDGFGTLLPEETVTLDLIYSPEKPKVVRLNLFLIFRSCCSSGLLQEYNFTLTCKSGIGRYLMSSYTYSSYFCYRLCMLYAGLRPLSDYCTAGLTWLFLFSVGWSVSPVGKRYESVTQ